MTFPVLYEVAIDKEACCIILDTTEGRGGGEGGRRTWGVRFNWDMNDGEMGSMVDFFHVLESNTHLTDNGDQLRWTLKKNGNFDIHSYYNAL